MVAALIASLWPLYKAYGLPRGWRPQPLTLWQIARRNTPLAAADAIEWGSRRLDIAILGLFFSPAIVGIYYVAQQVASLPQKLKTSFDPILGPVITQKLAEGDKKAVAKQVRQVGFWIIAAQTGIALALGIPGEAVMGLVGPHFVGGTGALAFLLAAEAIAATAVVSESALVYIARHRNLMISLMMIVVQVALSIVLILGMRRLQLPDQRPGGRPCDRIDAGARAGLDPEGPPARPPARRTGVGLALADRLGGLRRDHRRLGLHQVAAVAGMGRAVGRHPADPRRIRRGDLAPRLHPRGPRPLPQPRRRNADAAAARGSAAIAGIRVSCAPAKAGA